ncbi:MAG TPA: 30S ribosomal protein S1 [Deltaproteobacteria bacterium]|nr:30S ribosomal protein S1 [Deltaproteobacteria bacterium]
MSDKPIDESTENQQQSMADLLDSYAPEEGSAIQVGDKIAGKIISIGKESIFVDTGHKMDGVVDADELLDDNGELPYAIGDTLELYVVSLRGGEIRLSRAISGIGGLNMLQDAYDNAIPVEGRVTETIKGGFSIDVLKRRAFCPISQIDTLYVEHPEDYVGQTLRFVITELDENAKNIVLSRRVLLEQEQEKAKETFFETLSIGSVYEGRVSTIMPYGAFIELFPGVEGMVHISEISWARLASPDDILHTGDTVKVKVLDIQTNEAKGEKKLSLSMKQVDADPWESITERFASGNKIHGKVTRCMDFGCFVEIEPGIEGLVHISEMSYTKRVNKPQEMVSQGDIVDVMIKEIDQEKKRISLSMKDAEGDPWIDVKDKYYISQAVEGTIEKKERFGIFISLAPGITGLLPKSRINRFHDPAAIEKMQEGERIMVLIEEIDSAQRRITLAPGDSRDEDDWRTFSKDSSEPVSSLGEKLQQALKKKKKK